MMDRKFTITGIGELLWDIYPDKRYIGGAPSNAAVHSAQLDANGKIISSVGNDENGRTLLAELKSRGIDVSLVQISDGRKTGYVSVNLDKNGIPHFICSKDTAFDYLEWNPEMADCTQKSHAVITGTLCQRNPVSRKTIQRFLDETENNLIVYDVNFREWNSSVQGIVSDTAKKSHILKINKSECNALKQMLNKAKMEDFSFIKYLIDYFELKMCALTMGAKGAILTDGSQTISNPALDVEVIDTTGCGDAFTAAMTISFLKGKSLESILEYSLLVSGFVATKMSAVPIYNPEGINNFRKKSQAI